MKLSAPSPGPGQDLGLLLLPQSPGRHLPSSPVKTIVFDDGSFIEFYILTFQTFLWWSRLICRHFNSTYTYLIRRIIADEAKPLRWRCFQTIIVRLVSTKYNGAITGVYSVYTERELTETHALKSTCKLLDIPYCGWSCILSTGYVEFFFANASLTLGISNDF